MRRILMALAAFTLGAAAGCGHDMMGDEQMRTQLDLGREELIRHHQAVLAAPTLDEIQIDVARHERSMADMMDHMGDAMDHMSHCSGGDMMAMHAGMGDMDAEMTAHHANMAGAQTVEDARALCDEHVADMGAMMDSVEAGMPGMDCM